MMDFYAIIGAFEEASIEVRRLYWNDDQAHGWQFYIKVDGEERLRRVTKVERVVTSPGDGDYVWDVPDRGDIVVTVEP